MTKQTVKLFFAAFVLVASFATLSAFTKAPAFKNLVVNGGGYIDDANGGKIDVNFTVVKNGEWKGNFDYDGVVYEAVCAEYVSPNTAVVIGKIGDDYYAIKVSDGVVNPEGEKVDQVCEPIPVTYTGNCTFEPEYGYSFEMEDLDGGNLQVNSNSGW